MSIALTGCTRYVNHGNVGGGGDFFNLGGQQKEWEKPGNEHLKLKADKNKVVSYRVIKERHKLNLFGSVVSSSSSSTVDVLTDSNSTTTDVVYYAYVSSTTINGEKYNGLTEDLSMRQKNVQFFKGDKNTIAKVYQGDIFGGENNYFLIEAATTTLDSFTPQMAVSNNFIFGLFGESAEAAVSTTSPSGDAMFENSGVNTNYGGATNIAMGWNGGTANYRSAISFVMPNITGTVSDIKLFLKEQTNFGGSGTFEAHVASSSFDENTVTWANQPTFNPTIISSFSTHIVGVQYFGLYGASSTNPITVPANGASSYFLLKNSIESGSLSQENFASKENATVSDRPYFEITYTPSASRKRFIITN